MNNLLFQVQEIPFDETLYLKNIRDPEHEIKDECNKGDDD